MEFHWTDKYSVGNEIIDIQHKMLFSIINDLNRHIVHGDDFRYIEEVLDKMSAYAVIHFRTEEDLLFKSNYHAYKKHQLTHERFKKQILSSARQMVRSQSMDIAIEIHRFLLNWLSSHILEEDVKYCEHLK